MCPICKAAGDTFTLIDKSMFEAAAKTEGTLETELAYDDVPMLWTKDAKEAIRAVPAGFQRRRAKAKIEKSARKLGMTTITLEYAAPMIKRRRLKTTRRSSPTRARQRPLRPRPNTPP